MNKDMTAARVESMENEIQRQFDEAAGFGADTDEYRARLKNVFQLQKLLEEEVNLGKEERLSSLLIEKEETNLDISNRKMNLDEAKFEHESDMDRAKHDLECGREEASVDLNERRFEFEKEKFKKEMELEQDKVEVERLKTTSKPRFDWNALLMASANVIGIAIIVCSEVFKDRIITSKALKYAGSLKF